MLSPGHEPERCQPRYRRAEPGPSRGDDKDLFTRARQAITQLADQPRPAGAIPWGATGVYRLHAGSIRILYEVDDAVATIYVINVAVTR